MKANMHLSLSFRITNRIKRNLHLPFYSYMVSTQTLSLCQKKEPSQCLFIHFRLLYVKRIWRLGGFVHNFIQSTPEHIISGRERDFVWKHEHSTRNVIPTSNDPKFFTSQFWAVYLLKLQLSIDKKNPYLNLVLTSMCWFTPLRCASSVFYWSATIVAVVVGVLVHFVRWFSHHSSSVHTILMTECVWEREERKIVRMRISVLVNCRHLSVDLIYYLL